MSQKTLDCSVSQKTLDCSMSQTTLDFYMSQKTLDYSMLQKTLDCSVLQKTLNYLICEVRNGSQYPMSHPHFSTQADPHTPRILPYTLNHYPERISFPIPYTEKNILSW